MRGVTLEHLLAAAVSGQSYNQSRLGREAQRYSNKISRSRASDLPDDLHEEVAQEALLKFWERRSRSRNGKSFKQIYRTCVVAAIRTVRANYTPPGHRTRSSSKAADPKIAVEAIALASKLKLETLTARTFDEDGVFDVDQVSSESADHAMDAVEYRLDAQRILDEAPREIRRALALIHFEAKPKGTVADRAGISRFALKRRIDEYASQWRAAA